jgi:hypothetical protein
MEIGSVWIPGPKINPLSKPRKVIGRHPTDPGLVFTRTVTVDGGDTASRYVTLLDVQFLIENYAPLSSPGG